MKQLSSVAFALFALSLVGCDSSPPAQACSSADEECAEDSDCCTGYVCDAEGLCAFDRGMQCTADGLACTGDAECCTGACVDGTCGTTAGGECFACACNFQNIEGGCADVCSAEYNGGVPEFCQGLPAGPQCEICIVTTCGGNPFECN